ncbi:putative polysaccharide biosynthesis protein [Clostridium minihomine]|uniref:putative polysaccharide biosynthesis protein n=1 Tax=Clostridium minihomine TaxID=2045012 RepID=UPI000C75E519|nr:polysaccharide biosynthesis protein [Clostridium minihomine]
MGKASPRKSQSFLHGALILTASILVVKLIGALFKVPLTWIITEDGLGYFNTAYNFYGPIYSLATAGFPIAISRLVSESYTRGAYRDIRRIHRASAPIFVGTGTVGFVLMVAGAATYAKIIGNENALPALYALAPAILFSCLTAIYRGYYEGLRNMYPTAISEIIEALCKLVVGLTGACLILNYGMKEYESLGTVFGIAVASRDYARSAILPYAAAGAIFGVTVGSLFSFVFLFLRHKVVGDGITKENLKNSPPPRTMRKTVSRLVKTAIPIGVGAMAVNVAAMVDTTFLQTRIHKVMEKEPEVLLSMYQGMIPQINIETDTVPNFLFGCFSMALTLFMLVPAITQAFGISALPNVTAAWTRGEKSHLKRSIEAVLRVTALFSIPAGMGLAVMSGPVARLVFGVRPSLPITSRVLVIMGIGAIFASFSTPVNSMLQAVGRVDLPVKLLAVGLTIKVTLNYYLVGIPQINVLGAGAGTVVCYLFLTVAALFCLCKQTKIVPDFLSIFGKPLLASILCCTAAWALYGLLSRTISENLSTVCAVAGAMLVYALSLLCLRAICRDDILMLPKGQKIAKILEKHGWIG